MPPTDSATDSLPQSADDRATDIAARLRAGTLDLNAIEFDDDGDGVAPPAPVELPEVTEAAGDDTSPADKPKPPPEEAESEPPKNETPAAAAERKARIEKLQAAREEARKKWEASEERRRITETQAKVEADRKAIEAERAAIAKERAELAAEREEMLKPHNLVPFVKQHMSPQELGSFLAEELNPSKAAEWAVKRMQREQPATSAELEALRAKVEAFEKRDEERARSAADKQRYEAAMQQFAGSISADLAPVSAALAKARPEEVFRRADAIASRLLASGQSATYADVVSELEKELDELRSAFSPSPSTPATDAGQAPRPRTLAPSNTAGRSTIDPGFDDSLAAQNERVADLRRRLTARRTTT